MFKFLEFIVGISDSTLAKITSTVLLQLNNRIPQNIHWPSDMEFKNLLTKEHFALEELNNIVCIVDDTRFRISRPSQNDVQREFFNGKTRTHNLLVLFVVTLDGIPIFHSKAFEGRQNDQYAWNESGLRARFEHKEYGIIGDDMFSFNRVIDSVKIIGINPTRNSEPRGQYDQKNPPRSKQVGRVRVRIEHYFARLKQWKILRHAFRQHFLMRENQIDFDCVLSTVVRLNQLTREHSPLLGMQ